MSITIAAIHTASPMIETTKLLVKEYLQDNVKLINITDDSLIQEVIREDKITDAVKRRLNSYYYSAVDAGADIIFNTCSSVGEVAEHARAFIPIPIVKIDDAMTQEAVKIGTKIGVLATLNITLGPTVRLLKSKAKNIGKEIAVAKGLANGAFEALIGGDTERHDLLIIETAKGIADQCDTIVLAQGSMARIQKEIEYATGKTVLASPELGILALNKEIQNIKKKS